ncbi:uncharacterized protein EDB91DRAFT_365738 [Suillus paluster]|uniref:uncharacterized protein n=1 Tax=Suillus paluster TaxID=48578 RepID=UPI001B86AA21|nr:uncharacterized protein EDB91DRAFT_365738 [Suillus paluster]KAG1740229.1 hypothetical protein EDB91DRAFT_365738 [Suillus paluster]
MVTAIRCASRPSPFVCSHHLIFQLVLCFETIPLSRLYLATASNLYVGGFFGEWGSRASARGGQKNTGLQCNRQVEMLAEGVEFSADGYLADEALLWAGRC